MRMSFSLKPAILCSVRSWQSRSGSTGSKDRRLSAMGIVAGLSFVESAVKFTLAKTSSANLKGWLTKIGVATSQSAAFVVFLAFGSCWLVLGNIGTAFVRNARDLGDDTPDPARRASRHAGHSCQARRTSEGSREAHDDLIDVDNKDAEEVERERAHTRHLEGSASIHEPSNPRGCAALVQHQADR